jgi:type II secretory ATPase GspE/PulE/Tfp pilus assembly ATPase PilB-like protein
MIQSDYGEEHFDRTGLEYDSGMTLYRAGQCEKCSNTGYRGRMGIHELMEGTSEIKLMIKNQTGTERLFEQALKDGMSTLKQDGILKMFQGETDMAEVRRVCIN